MKLIFSVCISLNLWVSSFDAIAQNSLINQVKDFRIEKLEGKELTVSFTTSLDMLSPKTAYVKIKKGKLYKNGTYFGSFELVDKIKINKMSDKDLNVRVRITMEKEINVLEEGLKALMGNPLELKMTGVFKGTRFIFWKNFPFEFEEKVSLKDFINY